MNFAKVSGTSSKKMAKTKKVCKNAYKPISEAKG